MAQNPLSTTDVPTEFLEATFLLGHVPVTTLASDPRISYALYVPPDPYRQWHVLRESAKLPLLVWIHGTRRNLSPLYETELVSFSNSVPCAILAPLFPAGLEGPNDLDSFKKIRSPTVAFDRALLSMLDEIDYRWPGIGTDQVFMMGFSGGGQFTHRFLYLYPERLVAASIGAPGRVTLLDAEQPWPVGIADVQSRFGRTIDIQRIRHVATQLIVGAADGEIHGGPEFMKWVSRFRKKDKDKAVQSESHLPLMDQDRVQSIQSLCESWQEHGINPQFVVVDGVAHASQHVRKHVLQFLEPLIRTAFQGQYGAL